MKKLVSIILVLAMVLSLVACGSQSSGETASAEPAAEATEEAEKAEEAAEEDSTPAPETPAKRETISLTIGGGHAANTQTYTAIAQEYFQPKVVERCANETNYDIEWIDAYGGTIAKLPEAVSATEQGLIDVMVSSFAFDNNKLFLMNMPFYVPFSSPDAVVTTKAARATYEEFKEVYDELWARYNQKFLAFGPSGRYEMVTKFPITKFEDIANHKVAAAGGNLPWLDAGGCVPVQSNFNDCYTSIQTGVYEGYVAWPDAAFRYKFYEVAPYITQVGFGSMPIQGISINLDTWNSLPEEVQKIIEEEALNYELLNAEAANEWDDKSMADMEELGVNISQLPTEEVMKWIDALPNIPKEKAAEATSLGFPGEEIFKYYIQAQKDQGYEFPKEWVID